MSLVPLLSGNIRSAVPKYWSIILACQINTQRVLKSKSFEINVFPIFINSIWYVRCLLQASQHDSADITVITQLIIPACGLLHAAITLCAAYSHHVSFKNDLIPSEVQWIISSGCKHKLVDVCLTSGCEPDQTWLWPEEPVVHHVEVSDEWALQ